jgi:hypothetical protein
VSQWWSWFFTVTGASCVWLMSWRSWRWQFVGWLGATVSQSVWFTYGVVTRQWGFLASALLYGIVDVRMVWVMWYRNRKSSDKTKETK